MAAQTSDEADRQAAGRPFTVTGVLVGFLFLSVTALYGGIALVLAPDGSRIDAVMPIDLTHLVGTPFADYTIPGVVLVVTLGFGPLVAVYGLLTRRDWAWLAAVLVGPVLLVWLTVEVALIGYVSVLQPAYAVFGLALLVLAFTEPVRAYCRPA